MNQKISVAIDKASADVVIRYVEEDETPQQFVETAIRNEISNRFVLKIKRDQREALIFEMAREIAFAHGEDDSNEAASKYTELAGRIYANLPKEKI